MRADHVVPAKARKTWFAGFATLQGSSACNSPDPFSAVTRERPDSGTPVGSGRSSLRRRAGSVAQSSMRRAAWASRASAMIAFETSTTVSESRRAMVVPNFARDHAVTYPPSAVQKTRATFGCSATTEPDVDSCVCLIFIEPPSPPVTLRLLLVRVAQGVGVVVGAVEPTIDVHEIAACHPVLQHADDDIGMSEVQIDRAASGIPSASRPRT